MKEKIFKIFIIVSLPCALSFIFLRDVNENCKQLKMIENIEVTKQQGIIDESLLYKESDDDLFYTSLEIAEYMAEEAEERDTEQESFELIQSICPEAKLEEGKLVLPKKKVNKSPYTKLNIKKSTKPSKSSNHDRIVKELLKNAESCLGVPYVWGGTDHINGLDCSGFTQYIYGQIGLKIPRVSYAQCNFGKLVSRDALKPGDLLFFDTTNYRDYSDVKTPASEVEYAAQMASGYVPNVVSHVGLYVGNSTMIHAASGDGYVKYESLDKDYYKTRFINARRLIRD